MHFRFLLATSLVVGLFLFNLGFIFFGIYNYYLKADDIFHFLGGIFMGFFLLEFFLLTFKPKKNLHQHLFFTALVFCATVTAAMFWEFAEFLGGPMIGVILQHSIKDTMYDLMLGSAGGAMVAGFYFFLRA